MSYNLSRESLCQQPLDYSDNYHFKSLNDIIRALKKGNNHDSHILPIYRNAILDCRAIIEENCYDDYRPGLFAAYLFLFLPEKNRYNSTSVKNLRRYRRDKVNTWLEKDIVNMYEEGRFLGEWFDTYKELNSVRSKSVEYLIQRCNCITRRSNFSDFLLGLYNAFDVSQSRGCFQYAGVGVNPLLFWWDKNTNYGTNPFLNLEKEEDSLDRIFDIYYRITIHQKSFFSDPKIIEILKDGIDYEQKYITDEGNILNPWICNFGINENDTYNTPLCQLASWTSYEPDALALLPDGILQDIPLKNLLEYPTLCAQLSHIYDFEPSTVEYLIAICPDITIRNISTPTISSNEIIML